MNRAYNELWELLKQSSYSEISKIPDSFLEFIRNNMDPDYCPDFPASVPIKSLDLLPMTKGLLSILMMTYLGEPMSRRSFSEQLTRNDQKLSDTDKITEAYTDEEYLQDLALYDSWNEEFGPLPFWRESMGRGSIMQVSGEKKKNGITYKLPYYRVVDRKKNEVLSTGQTRPTRVLSTDQTRPTKVVWIGGTCLEQLELPTDQRRKALAEAWQWDMGRKEYIEYSEEKIAPYFVMARGEENATRVIGKIYLKETELSEEQEKAIAIESAQWELVVKSASSHTAYWHYDDTTVSEPCTAYQRIRLGHSCHEYGNEYSIKSIIIDNGHFKGIIISTSSASVDAHGAHKYTGLGVLLIDGTCDGKVQSSYDYTGTETVKSKFTVYSIRKREKLAQDCPDEQAYAEEENPPKTYYYRFYGKKGGMVQGIVLKNGHFSGVIISVSENGKGNYSGVLFTDGTQDGKVRDEWNYGGCEYNKHTYKEYSLKKSERTFQACLDEVIAAKTIQLSDDAHIIHARALEGREETVSVLISDTIEAIESEAFAEYISLEEIHIPESVREIGSFAFEGCTGLKEIVIPEAVSVIRESTFFGCSSLEYAKLQGTVEIKVSAFYGCGRLSQILLPESLRKIGMLAFRSCEALEEVNIPEGVMEIQMGAFYGCKSLKKVVVPASLTEIGDDVFASCSPELTVYVQKGSTAEQYCREKHINYIC